MLTGLLGSFALGVGVLVGATDAAAVVAGVVAVAVGTWGFAPVMQATLLDRFAADQAAGDFGALKLVYTGLGSLGPTYVGVVAGRLGYPAAFAGLVALLAVGVGLLVWWTPG